MNKLPDKPSELLMVAMQDFEACENDPRYEIDMGEWHTPIGQGKCSVCMAGAIMANTLGTKVKNECHPYITGHRNASKLRAIDSIRSGELGVFFNYLGMYNPFTSTDGYSFEKSDFCRMNYIGSLRNLSNSDIPRHREEFKNWIVSFIGILEAEGM